MTPTVFQALAIKHGLRLYAKTGIKPNSSYTPSAMLRVAAGITGAPRYKLNKHGYNQAIEDLTRWINKEETADEAN